jgi:quinolinate synthase
VPAVHYRDIIKHTKRLSYANEYSMLVQSPLPPQYAERSDADLRQRIHAARETLGRHLVILGHHYQQDDVIACADFTGDSLKLSQLAAEQTQAEYIVFCGVHFMAESADILTSDRQQVILPDLTAGCSMADMAHIDQVEAVWPVLEKHSDLPITPITYVNSSAAVKAFVGRHDGACCTSSNAQQVLAWALHGAVPADTRVGRHVASALPARRDRRDEPGAQTTGPVANRDGHRILFLPDQHLGRNTAYTLGWPLDSMVVYDPDQPLGGVAPERLRAARVVLWKGHCAVHQLFTPEQCDAVRALRESYKIIVHPECTWEVCQKADYVGSTEYIIKTVRAAPPGTSWAVGTEVHLVSRLATTCPDKHIRSLAGMQCLCSTMYRIDLKHLCWVLKNLVAGRVVNRVAVDAETKRWSHVALDRMLALRPTSPAPARHDGP